LQGTRDVLHDCGRIVSAVWIEESVEVDVGKSGGSGVLDVLVDVLVKTDSAVLDFDDGEGVAGLEDAGSLVLGDGVVEDADVETESSEGGWGEGEEE